LLDGPDTHARLQRDVAVLRAQAEKEKQLNRRVELNLEITTPMKMVVSGCPTFNGHLSGVKSRFASCSTPFCVSIPSARC
jgi:hypothetical protein